MGATVAQHLALQNKRFSQKVASVQMIAPTAPYGSKKGVIEAMKSVYRTSPWELESLKAGFLGNRKGYIPSKKIMNRVLFNCISKDEQDERYNKRVESSPLAGFQEYFWSLDYRKTNKIPGELHWSQIYVGSDDKLTPPAVANEVKIARGSHVKKFAGRGHCSPYEEGHEQLLEQIVTFVNLVNNITRKKT